MNNAVRDHIVDMDLNFLKTSSFLARMHLGERGDMKYLELEFLNNLWAPGTE